MREYELQALEQTLARHNLPRNDESLARIAAVMIETINLMSFTSLMGVAKITGGDFEALVHEIEDESGQQFANMGLQDACIALALSTGMARELTQRPPTAH